MLMPHVAPRLAALLALSALATIVACSSAGDGGDPGDSARGGETPAADDTATGSRTPPKPGDPGTAPPNQAPESPIPDGANISCAETAAAGSFYAKKPRALVTDAEVPLCVYSGKVLLVVNGASHCGYTPQYGPLQALYAQYKDSGLVVLAFPSRSFNQEFDDEADVSTFCTTEYGITFPLFEIADVTGDQMQPVYQWLTAQPGFEGPIPWNFEKFLIGRDGLVKKRIPYTTSPDDPEVVAAIEAELAKP